MASRRLRFRYFILLLIGDKNLVPLKKTFRLFFAALLPGFLFYHTKNLAWFSAAFVAVACCMPYGSKHYSIYRMLFLCLSYTILFCIQTYALHFPLVYGIFLFCMGFFYVYTTRNHPALKEYCMWIFVPSLYNSIAFHDNISNHIQHYFAQEIFFTPVAFFCAALSCYIVFPEKKNPQLKTKINLKEIILNFISELKFDLKERSHPVFRQALRTGCAVVVSFCLVYFLHLKEGQWLIWSSAVVILTDRNESYQKSKGRFLGLLFGIGTGFILIQILPQSLALTFLFCFFIFVTLSGVIKVYWLSYGLRCALILGTGATLGAGMASGLERLENVVLGVLVGTLATLFLWPNKKLSNNLLYSSYF